MMIFVLLFNEELRRRCEDQRRRYDDSSFIVELLITDGDFGISAAG